MPVSLNNLLVVGISSRALFDLEAEEAIFRADGLDAYRNHQLENEDQILKLGAGGFLLALIETVSAKMRIFRAPEFLATAFLLGVLALLVHLLLGA